MLATETWIGLAVISAALLFDGLIGEPPSRIHPVVWMGKLVRFVRAPFLNRGKVVQLIGGVTIVASCAGVSAGIWRLLSMPSYFNESPLSLIMIVVAILGVFILASCFALRMLVASALEVRDALEFRDIEYARKRLGWLCSRDASSMNAEEITEATVESVAENLSDSFIAPLFYTLLFGVTGAVVYRAVNTMDAMIGYHGKYEYLGKAAARLDDLLNIIPARLTAILLLMAGMLYRARFRLGLRVWLRDRGNTESPNAGHPISVIAGLLGVSLTKLGHYSVGDSITEITTSHIQKSCNLMIVAAVLFVPIILLGFVLRVEYGWGMWI